MVSICLSGKRKMSPAIRFLESFALNLFVVQYFIFGSWLHVMWHVACICHLDSAINVTCLIWSNELLLLLFEVTWTWNTLKWCCEFSLKLHDNETPESSNSLLQVFPPHLLGTIFYPVTIAGVFRELQISCTSFKTTVTIMSL